MIQALIAVGMVLALGACGGSDGAAPAAAVPPTPVNARPVANAGPDQTVTALGTLVNLDGSASTDADTDPLAYRWTFQTRPPGSSAQLDRDDIVAPSFTVDVHGDYVLRLVVNDGRIDSVADTVTVAAPAPPPAAGPIEVDAAREASIAVTFDSGGTVATTAADGTVYTLVIPPGSVNAPTTIRIAPLIAVHGVPIGRFIAGIRAEPEGLRFGALPTLSIALPAGVRLPALGLQGFTFDQGGANVAFAAPAVSVAGGAREVVMPVPHFSAIGIAELDETLIGCGSGSTRSAEHEAACGALRPLYDAERARLAAEGGPLGSAFVADLMAVLEEWARSGVLTRMRDAQDTPLEDYGAVYDEWTAWLNFWASAGGMPTDRTNAALGRPLGALVDTIMEELRLLSIARINALNLECLRDRDEVLGYVTDVFDVWVNWALQGAGIGIPHPPWEQVYCIDIDIQAFPPPVLTPGVPATLPVDLRVRYSDGVELPGEQLAVVVTATDASVTPAGGFLTTPFLEDLTLGPTASASTVTISARLDGDFAHLVLPHRSRTFDAGQPSDARVAFTSGLLSIEIGSSYGPGGSDIDEEFSPADVVIVNVPQEEGGPVNGDRYVASGSGSVSRAVREEPGGVFVVTTTGEARIFIEYVSGDRTQITRGVFARVRDEWCFTLSGPFDVVEEWSGSEINTGEFSAPYYRRFVQGQISADTGPASSGQPFRLAAGDWCRYGFGGMTLGYSPGFPIIGVEYSTFNARATLRPAG